MKNINKDRISILADLNKDQCIYNLIEKKKSKNLTQFTSNLYFLPKKKYKLTHEIIKFLKSFLTKDGKIFSKSQTEVKTNQQRFITKSIKKIRNSKIYRLNYQLID